MYVNVYIVLSINKWVVAVVFLNDDKYSNKWWWWIIEGWNAVNFYFVYLL